MGISKNPRSLVILFATVLLGFANNGVAQSDTTNKLQAKCDNAMSLYFYKNTLHMLNQSENQAFDDIVKDIDKMKFLMIDKPTHNFGSMEYQKITAGYKSERYEEIMTSRFEGKNFDVYLREKNGITKGMVILVNDSSNLYVLDILGKVELNKITQLFNTLDSSAEIGKMIKSITDEGTRSDRSKRRADKN